jgi:hypothetical protein
MIDRGIVVLGIPIPLPSSVFLSIVAIHVAAALVCVVAGVVAMLSAMRAAALTRMKRTTVRGTVG